jgi:hypothetical protein
LPEASHDRLGQQRAREVEEYEINTALIEALNSVEKRSAIETGQEVDRSDIGVGFGIADQHSSLRNNSKRDFRGISCLPA